MLGQAWRFKSRPVLRWIAIGRIIEVPRTVCIRVKPWLDQQTDSDLILAFKGTFILCDCIRVVRRVHDVERRRASRRRSDYDATDAFSPNRWLDSFAMQLVLRTDTSPKTPDGSLAPHGSRDHAGNESSASYAGRTQASDSGRKPPGQPLRPRNIHRSSTQRQSFWPACKSWRRRLARGSGPSPT